MLIEMLIEMLRLLTERVQSPPDYYNPNCEPGQKLDLKLVSAVWEKVE